MFPRDVLLRYRWTPSLDPADLEIIFVSRGHPGDVEVVRGDEIDDIRRDSFVVGGKVIPYHRVVEIRDGERVVFRRQRSQGKG